MCLVHLCPAWGHSRLQQLAGTSVHPCVLQHLRATAVTPAFLFLGPRAASWAGGPQSSTTSVLGPCLPPEPYCRPGSLRSGFQHPRLCRAGRPWSWSRTRAPAAPSTWWPGHGKCGEVSPAGACFAHSGLRQLSGPGRYGGCSSRSVSTGWLGCTGVMRTWLSGGGAGRAHCSSRECARGSLWCWSPLSSLRTFSLVGRRRAQTQAHLSPKSALGFSSRYRQQGPWFPKKLPFEGEAPVSEGRKVHESPILPDASQALPTPFIKLESIFLALAQGAPGQREGGAGPEWSGGLFNLFSRGL